MGLVKCLGRRDSARARVKELKWVNGVEGEKGRESLEETRGPRSSRIRRIVRLWRENVHPGTHDQHAVAYGEARGRLVPFGGKTSQGYSPHAYEWDGQEWHRITPVGRPPQRYGHTMVYDAARQRVLMFGGVQSVGSGLVFFNDTWEWDGNGNVGPEDLAILLGSWGLCG